VIERILNGGVVRDGIAPRVLFLSSSLPGLPSKLSRIRPGGGTAKERELYRVLRSSGARANLKRPDRGRQSPVYLMHGLDEEVALEPRCILSPSRGYDPPGDFRPNFCSTRPLL